MHGGRRGPHVARVSGQAVARARLPQHDRAGVAALTAGHAQSARRTVRHHLAAELSGEIVELDFFMPELL